MAKGFNWLVVETAHHLYVVGTNVCNCIIAAHPGNGGAEIIIVDRFLGGLVVIAFEAVNRSSPTQDCHGFFIELLDGSIS